jgi:hypothetical protein
MLQVSCEVISSIEPLIQVKQEVLVSIDHLTALPANQMNVRPMLVGGIDYPTFAQINAAGKSLLHQ